MIRLLIEGRDSEVEELLTWVNQKFGYQTLSNRIKILERAKWWLEMSHPADAPQPVSLEQFTEKQLSFGSPPPAPRLKRIPAPIFPARDEKKKR
ncbi:MAG TPA: hypothetical protein VGK99_17730 [Acidobacteriota bacterium]|jgi:hypothetical protein